jgi:MFS family permease
MSRATQSFAPLRHRGFRLLAGGQLASNVGDAFYMVALPWYVLADHGGALLLGTVLAAYGIPRTVLLTVGGQASDRWGPWTVMMASDTVRVLAAAGLAVAAATGPARAVVLVPIAVVLGAGEGMFMPGSFAIIPAGNALVSAGTQLATLVGPALGGTMVALLGPSPAFGLDAASFAVSALTLAGVRAAKKTATKTTAASNAVATNAAASSAVTINAATSNAAAGSAATINVATDNAATIDAATGNTRATTTEPADRPALTPVPAPTAPAGHAATGAGTRPKTVTALLRTERVIQIGLLLTVVANLGSGGIDGVALPSLAHGPFHTGAGGFGALIAAFGGGALLGTLVSGHLGRLRRPAIVGSVAFLIEAVFMAAVPYLGGAFGAAAALVVLGAMNGFGNVVMITAFQRWAPPELLGRLAGVLTLASLGVYPISVAVAAGVVHGLGPAPFFPLAGAALGFAILFGLSQRTWRNFGAAPDRPATDSPALHRPAPDRPATDSRASDSPADDSNDSESTSAIQDRPACDSNDSELATQDIQATQDTVRYAS